jgi:1,4-dihydroxy-2-naphthoate octaprenyltransferase
MAVRLGRTGTKLEFLLLLVVAFAAPALGVYGLGWSPWVLMSLHALLLLAGPMHGVLRNTSGTDPRTLIPHLGRTAQAAGLYGMLLAFGLALS